MRKLFCTKSLLLFLWLNLSLYINSSATVPVSEAFKSPNERITLVLHYEDVTPIAQTRSKLLEALPALEQVFIAMLENKILDQDFPNLVIVANKSYSVAARFEYQPTSLTFSPHVSLVCNNPDTQKFEPVTVGQSYIIYTTTGLLTFGDLVAFITLLGELTANNQTIEIREEGLLQQTKETELFREYWHQNFEWENTGNQHNHATIRAGMLSGKTSYTVIDRDQKVLANFPVLETPITTMQQISVPAEENSTSVFAIASLHKAFLANAGNGKLYPLIFSHLQEYYNSIHNVDFFNFPSRNSFITIVSGAYGTVMAIYEFDRNVSEWEQIYATLTINHLTDTISAWQSNNLITEFVPAFESTIIRNAGTIIEKPKEGWGPARNFYYPKRGAIILLFGLAFGVILVFFAAKKRVMLNKIKFRPRITPK